MGEASGLQSALRQFCQVWILLCGEQSGTEGIEAEGVRGHCTAIGCRDGLRKQIRTKSCSTLRK